MGVKTYRLLQYDSDAPSVPVIVDLPITGAQWTFQGITGTCDSGKFVADATTSMATTQVEFSGVTKSGSTVTAMLIGIDPGNFVLFIDGTGAVAAFTVSAVTPEISGCVTFSLSNPTGALTWAGDYSITFPPSS